MFRLVKCTMVYNSKILKNQCIVFGNCGHHTTAVLNSDNHIKSVKTHAGDTAYRPVADFYAGKSVFLTGGTGFLGKVFIEKLLSSCTDIDKIYVLIRGKKGMPAERRLQDYLNTPVFTKLKNTNPEYLNKVVAINGDMAEPELGIAPEDQQTIIDKVSIVFHSAAIVKFIEPFKYIYEVNVEGTRKVLNLSKRISNLEIFVHISTAFSNSHKMIIDEVVYPSPKKLEDVQFFLKNHAEDEEEIKKFIKGHANTYTFSKGLAEALVMENRGNMPTIVIRPSVVSPAYREPMPGWVDSWVAGTGIFTDVARGLTRIGYGDSDVVLDMIPVDYVCNFTIAAAAKCPKSKELLVYSSCSGTTNPITWQNAANLFTKYSPRFGYRELPFPYIFMMKSPLVVSALTFLLQKVPAFAADVLLWVRGKKPKYMKQLPRAILLRDVLKPFTSNSFVMMSNRAQKLIDSLDENDRELFMCNPKTINWNKYMPIYCFGVKEYLLSKNKGK